MKRRTLLTAGVAALVAGPAVAAVCSLPEPVADDPFLAAALQYRAELKAYNDMPVDLSDEEDERMALATWRRFYDADPMPPIMTIAGAAIALRTALDEQAFIDDFAERCVRTALAYLERLANSTDI